MIVFRAAVPIGPPGVNEELPFSEIPRWSVRDSNPVELGSEKHFLAP